VSSARDAPDGACSSTSSVVRMRSERRLDEPTTPPGVSTR